MKNTWFSHLTVVDLLLDGVVGDETVDETRLRLAVAVDPAHGLGVVTRVPRGVQHHNPKMETRGQ